MFMRYDFMQGLLLKNVTDPEARNGVCAALCDFWLRAIKAGNASPDQRLRELTARFSEVIAHQEQYQRERERVGPVAARLTERRRRRVLKVKERSAAIRPAAHRYRAPTTPGPPLDVPAARPIPSRIS